MGRTPAPQRVLIVFRTNDLGLDFSLNLDGKVFLMNQIGSRRVVADQQQIPPLRCGNNRRDLAFRETRMWSYITPHRAYLHEQAFCFNNWKDNHANRFQKALDQASAMLDSRAVMVKTILEFKEV